WMAGVVASSFRQPGGIYGATTAADLDPCRIDSRRMLAGAGYTSAPAGADFIGRPRLYSFQALHGRHAPPAHYFGRVGPGSTVICWAGSHPSEDHNIIAGGPTVLRSGHAVDVGLQPR